MDNMEKVDFRDEMDADEEIVIDCLHANCEEDALAFNVWGEYEDGGIVSPLTTVYIGIAKFKDGNFYPVFCHTHDDGTVDDASVQVFRKSCDGSYDSAWIAMCDLKAKVEEVA